MNNLEKEITRTVPFTIAPKIICTETSLPKVVNGLYNENYKTLLKDKNKWKHISCSWIGKSNIVNMSVLLKVIHYNLYQNPRIFFFFSRNRKTHPEFRMEYEGIPNSQISLEKEQKIGGLRPPYFKTDYNATVIKTM